MGEPISPLGNLGLCVLVLLGKILILPIMENGRFFFLIKRLRTTWIVFIPKYITQCDCCILLIKLYSKDDLQCFYREDDLQCFCSNKK